MLRPDRLETYPTEREGQDPMRVSVVIPTYNCASFVNEAVQSALKQSHPSAEVIVVDDGSTDDTEERLRHLVDRIRYIRKKNGGVATARNRGMQEANGDAIAFLDADDTWHPRKLEIQVAFLQQNDRVGLVGTRTIDWPNESFATLPTEMPAATAVKFEQMVVKNLFTTSSMLVRKSVVDKVGEFDPELRGPEDYDFWLRCLRIMDAANLESPLTGYREVPGSLGKRAVSMEAGMQRILDKLTAAGAWKGHWLLHQKAVGYFHFSCGWMHHAAGHRKEAVSHLIRSLAKYPLPYVRGEMRYYLARVRLLRRALWNWIAGGRSGANS